MRHAPDTLTRADTWRTDAACRDLPNPDAMFPDHNAGKIAAAKKVCRGCPVWRECLDTTMRAEGSRGTDHRWGVVAGLTEAQRVALYERNPGRWAQPKPPAAPKQKRKPREPVTTRAA